MRVVSTTLRDFRCYREAQVSWGETLTVVSGPNGAGKTNLLEALYFGCTGRSCRTANEREVVRFGASTTRVLVRSLGEDGPHETSVGFTPGEPKRLRIDGAPVERLIDSATRPLVSVFLPDRLDLVKGAPTLRRAHLDQLVAALWPTRKEARRVYGQALAQRNALITRIRSGRGSRVTLTSWDTRLAICGIELMRYRADACRLIVDAARRCGELLGLGADLTVAYRPRSHAGTPEELLAELAARTDQDLERGFTAHGPHRDELGLCLGERDLRAYGSQGQQRVCLLALLLAEREAIALQRGTPPVMLLDDVMSELDRARREALVELLRGHDGQSILTTTDVEHVPEAMDPGIARLVVSDGAVFEGALA